MFNIGAQIEGKGFDSKVTKFVDVANFIWVSIVASYLKKSADAQVLGYVG